MTLMALLVVSSARNDSDIRILLFDLANEESDWWSCHELLDKEDTSKVCCGNTAYLCTSCSRFGLRQGLRAGAADGASASVLNLSGAHETDLEVGAALLEGVAMLFGLGAEMEKMPGRPGSVIIHDSAGRE